MDNLNLKRKGVHPYTLQDYIACHVMYKDESDEDLNVFSEGLVTQIGRINSWLLDNMDEAEVREMPDFKVTEKMDLMYAWMTEIVKGEKGELHTNQFSLYRDGYYFYLVSTEERNEKDVWVLPIDGKW